MSLISSHLEQALRSLNVSKNRNYWPKELNYCAPHKPFLLLSLIDCFEQGVFHEDRITTETDLIEGFFYYWNEVLSDDFRSSPIYPFYHMDSEPFWELVYKSGEDHFSAAPSSFERLLERVNFARISEELVRVLSSADGREKMRLILLDEYFLGRLSDTLSDLIDTNFQANEFARRISHPSGDFVAFVKPDYDPYKKVRRKVRKLGFGKLIKENYRYTCAICQKKIGTPDSRYIVDGAHIIPWTKSYNDDPRNGIALCKNHHWLYDRYLITIDSDYKVVFSKWLARNGNEIGHLIHDKGRKILLPEDSDLHPAAEALKYHYMKWEKAYE